MPALSVVIPTHNSQDTIGPLLESILSQDFNDIEVLIIDDASSDATESIVKRFNVRYMRLDSRSGPSAARNYGVSRARSQCIVFFDSDVVLREGVLRRFHEKLSDRAIRAVIGLYDKIPLNDGLVPWYKAIQEQVWFDDIVGDTVTTFTPSVGAIRKDLFDRLGGFDSVYTGAEVEDYEFSHKLLKEDRIYLDRTIRVRHRFPSFEKLVKSYARRCFLWAQLFLKDPRFDNNATTSRQALAVMFYAASVLLLLLGPIMASCSWAGLTPLTVALFLDRRFVSYAFKEKGLLFAVYTAGMNLFLSLIILVSGGAGIIYGLTKQHKESRR